MTQEDATDQIQTSGPICFHYIDRAKFRGYFSVFTGAI